MNSKVISIILIAAAAAAGYMLYKPGGGNGDEIVVAVVGPMTGQQATFGARRRVWSKPWPT